MNKHVVIKDVWHRNRWNITTVNRLPEIDRRPATDVRNSIEILSPMPTEDIVMEMGEWGRLFDQVDVSAPGEWWAEIEKLEAGMED